MITIAICTWNRATLLKPLLEDLVNETAGHPDVEVLVIDNNCTDDTPALLESFLTRLPLRAVRETRQGLSRARNRAIAEARGDLLIFIDDDVRLQSGWLDAYRRAFDDPQLLAAGGRVIPVWPPHVPRWIGDRRIPPFSTIVPFHEHGDAPKDISDRDAVPPTANVAVRMSVVRQLDGFREDLGIIGPVLRGCDDTEYLHRVLKISGAIRYLPDAAVTHPVEPRRLSLWFNLRYLYGGGASQASFNPPAPGTRTIGPVPLWTIRRIATGLGVAPLALITGNLRRSAKALGDVAVMVGYARGLMGDDGH